MKLNNVLHIILIALSLTTSQSVTASSGKIYIKLINDSPTNCCGEMGTVIICNNGSKTTLRPGESINITINTQGKGLRILHPVTNVVATTAHYAFDIAHLSNNASKNSGATFQVNLSDLISFFKKSYSINLDSENALMVEQNEITHL